jgi:predicted transcriptional regulator
MHQFTRLFYAPNFTRHIVKNYVKSLQRQGVLYIVAYDWSDHWTIIYWR